MHTLADLARVLRTLRRRHARHSGRAELTYREIAAATGWSHGIVGEYLSGRVLPPTERFDALIRLLGATPAEQGSLATARDRIEEGRRKTSRPLPRQLPVDVYAFTGRAGQLSELDSRLAEQRSIVVTGTAGVGKTALAIRWAHRIAERFPDGQLYVDLRGYDPDQPVLPADALASFLRGLGVDAADIPGDLGERAALYRTTVADRRVLVLLDNASSPDQVRPLLPGNPACGVVVTSRDDLSGLVARDGAARIDLDALPSIDAADLLRALIGERVDADPAAAVTLADCCARLPLALRIAAELATSRPGTPLTTLLADFHDARRRLDLLDTADPRTAIRSVFSWSYRHLTPDTGRAFGLLGLHPGLHFDVYAVAALASVTPQRAQTILAELTRAHLVEPAVRGAYALHDLLRSYAVERTDAEDRTAAVTRLLDHYITTAEAATHVLYPHDSRRDATASDLFDEPKSAALWLEDQRSNLVAVAVHAARHGWPSHSVALSRILWRHFEVAGHYQEALALHTSAVEATGDAYALANLGGIHWWLGDYSDAENYLERSLAGHRERADVDGEARAAARLGLVLERLGRYREAMVHMRAALRSNRRTGNRHGEGAQLINLGTLHRRLGQYAEAADHHREAAAIFAEIGEPRLEGYALGNLGAVLSLVGEHDIALGHLDRALAQCRAAGDRGGEGSALNTIGIVHIRLGNRAEALDHLDRALAISRDIGDRSLETETLNALGETVGATQDGLAYHLAALAITDQTGDLYEHARALEGLGRWQQALDIYARLGVPEAERLSRQCR